MNKLVFLILAVSSVIMAKAMTIPDYHPYQQAQLNKAQLQFSDIAPLLEHYQTQPSLTVTELGRSVEQQPIYQIKLGHGKTRVLAWSQMHGDESTATAALFDLLNYLEAPEQAAWREQLFADITLYIIPMLNPDGAAKRSRVNAQGIDINRDALALQSPEGQLLMAAAKQIKPHFAFNLHDQNRFHAAGAHLNPATISLLAPAFNAEREINPSRRAAMQLIALVQPWLEQQIPQHVGRYADDWSARSFGDTFAAMGISTVLVESGAYRGDDNRQVARRLNFQLYVAWLAAIASGSYQQADLALYDAIPFNRSGGMKDVLLQGLTVTIGATTATLDLAINLALTGDRRARIDELGDLSLFSAFHQFSVQGLTFKAGQVYPLNTALSLDTEAHLSLLRQGYTHFAGDKALLQANSRLPVLLNPLRPSQGSPQLWQGATFLLVNDEGEIVQAMLNGQLVSVDTGTIHNPLGT